MVRLHWFAMPILAVSISADDHCEEQSLLQSKSSVRVAKQHRQQTVQGPADFVVLHTEGACGNGHTEILGPETSLQTCADLCRDHENCSFFAFAEGQGCHLYNDCRSYAPDTAPHWSCPDCTAYMLVSPGEDVEPRTPPETLQVRFARELRERQDYQCTQHRDTGGTCHYLGCRGYRGATECIDGHCMCAPDSCSNDQGVCVTPDIWHSEHCDAGGAETDEEQQFCDHYAAHGYHGMDTPPRHDCASEYTLGGLGADQFPDLIESAHEWCRSDLVPENLRVPEKMRGLYWMKGLHGLSDVAFCGSLGEYNREANSMRIAVWTGFVAGREPHEEVPQLILDTSGMGSRFTQMGFALGRNALIYDIQFHDEELTDAIIVPSAHLFNAISSHPMHEIDVTEDGQFTSQRPGDLFTRPSFFFGFYSGSYEAVKVMYDDGTIIQDRAEAMRADHRDDGVTYMRYAPSC